MPDNATAPAVGEVFAFDEIGGVKFSRGKLIHGPDGVNDGDVSNANPLPVKSDLRAVAVVAGQATITGEAALPTAVARRFRVRALLDNTDIVYLGPGGVTAATGYPLWPGDATPPLELSNLNVLRAIAAAGTQKIAYLGEV